MSSPVKRFRPHWLPRFGIVIPTAIPIGAVLTLGPERPSSDYLGMGALVAATIYLALRWMLLGGVVLTSQHIRVHGILWSRSIPRPQVIGTLGTLIGVRWTTRSGWRRLSPTVCFWTIWNDPVWFEGYNYDVGREIREWSLGHSDWADPRPPGRHL